MYIISSADTGMLERLGYFERARGNNFLTVVILVSVGFVILSRSIISYISNWFRIWRERLYILNWRWHRLHCFHTIVTLGIIIRIHCCFLCIFCYERFNILAGGSLRLKEIFRSVIVVRAIRVRSICHCLHLCMLWYYVSNRHAAFTCEWFGCS